MRNNYFIAILLSFLIISCKSSKSTNYEITFKKPTTVVDSLYMKMPGMVYFVNNNIIIEDPFATDYFYKIYNESGLFLKNIAPVGKSSVEFSSTNLIKLNNDIVISDINRGNAIIYKSETDSIYQFDAVNADILKKFSIINIDDNMFVSTNIDFVKENDGGLLNIYDKNSVVKSFGALPIDEEFSNKFDMYQGVIDYNKNNNLLVFFSFRVPYYAIYKKNGSDFTLVKEETYGKFMVVPQIRTGNKLKKSCTFKN